MNLTKIGMWNDISIPLYRIELQNLEDIQDVHIILVPDKETYHEITGLALLYNKAVFVHLLEPGKLLGYESTLPSPWHVNTDKYHLTFTISSTIHTPHLLFNCL